MFNGDFLAEPGQLPGVAGSCLRHWLTTTLSLLILLFWILNAISLVLLCLEDLFLELLVLLLI